MTILEIDGIHTYYGESHVLQGVDLSIEKGENVALIGRNGAGKTTTIKSILQVENTRDGSIRYKSEEITDWETHDIVQSGIGWVPEDRRMFENLTVKENIKISIDKGDSLQERLDDIYTIFPDLEELQDLEAGNLSGGQQQMLAISRGIVRNNDLLLIDEPSEGLAPLIVEQVAEALDEISDDISLLLVEQNLPLALKLADRFYILQEGEIVDEGSTENVTPEDEKMKEYLAV